MNDSLMSPPPSDSFLNRKFPSNISRYTMINISKPDKILYMVSFNPRLIILMMVIRIPDIINGLSFMIMYLESLTKIIDTRLDKIRAIANSYVKPKII